MDCFTYKLIRRKRKSISLRVYDGEIIVVAPIRCDKSVIEAFLCEKRGWILSRLEQSKKELDFLDSLRDDKVVNAGQIIQRPICFTRSSDYYSYHVEKTFEEFVAISKKLGLTYASFRWCNAKTLWGSCDGENNVKLNRRVSILPFYLREYVIVHELAHTKIHNHSSAFWALMDKLLPDVKIRRKELKSYTWLMRVLI